MKKQPQSILREILTNTRPKTKQEQLKQYLKRSQQKLTQLKNITNPSILQRIKQVQKEIKRLQILTINDDDKSQNILKQLASDDYGSQQQNQKKKYIINLMKSEVTNQESIMMLRNVTTKIYGKELDMINVRQYQLQKQSKKQFSSVDFIAQIQQKIAPNVMEIQIYPLLNRYLSAKSSLLTKIIQLNPQKRHNNSLLIPHQRVMLKEHLDITRRIIDDLDKKSQELQDQLNKDFVVVKNKWEESQRELIKLSQQ